MGDLWSDTLIDRRRNGDRLRKRAKGRAASQPEQHSTEPPITLSRSTKSLDSELSLKSVTSSGEGGFYAGLGSSDPSCTLANGDSSSSAFYCYQSTYSLSPDHTAPEVLSQFGHFDNCYTANGVRIPENAVYNSDPSFSNPSPNAGQSSGSSECDDSLASQLYRGQPAAGATTAGSIVTPAPPLHLAVSEGHAAVVKTLISWGATVDATDECGRTALHYATIQGDEIMAQLLFERGADVNRVDGDGWTPLHHAAKQGHNRIVELLIQHGATIVGIRG